MGILNGYEDYNNSNDGILEKYVHQHISVRLDDLQKQVNGLQGLVHRIFEILEDIHYKP